MTPPDERHATWARAFAADDARPVVASCTAWLRGSARRRFREGLTTTCAPGLASFGGPPPSSMPRPDEFMDGAMAFLGEPDVGLGARMGFAERCQDELHAEERRLVRMESKAFAAGLAAGTVAVGGLMGLTHVLTLKGAEDWALRAALAWATLSVLSVLATLPDSRHRTPSADDGRRRRGRGRAWRRMTRLARSGSRRSA